MRNDVASLVYKGNTVKLFGELLACLLPSVVGNDNVAAVNSLGYGKKASTCDKDDPQPSPTVSLVI